MNAVKTYTIEKFVSSKMELIKRVLLTIITITLCLVAVKDDVFITYDKAKTAMFLMEAATLFMGMFNGASIYNNEKQLIRHQCRSGLSPMGYLLGNVLYQLILCILQALGITVMYFSIINPDEINTLVYEGYADYYISIFLMIFAADILGMFVSLISNSEKTASTIQPLVMIAQLTLSGILFTFKDGSAMLKIQDLMIFRKGMSCMGSLANLNSSTLPTQMQLLYPNIEKPFQEIYDATASNLVSNWTGMICISSVMLIINYWILYFRINVKDR